MLITLTPCSLHILANPKELAKLLPELPKDQIFEVKTCADNEAVSTAEILKAAGHEITFELEPGNGTIKKPRKPRAPKVETEAEAPELETPKAKRPRYTIAQKQEVLDWLKANPGRGQLKQAAEHFGVSPSAIAGWANPKNPTLI